MATPHNSAAKGDIAPTVLFPGDPLRAQYVAEHYFKNPRQVTGVRNVLGFTGTWQGKKVSVMASGMGGPSAGIYAYELYTWYGAERIIRIGTAGGLQPFLKLGDLVLAMSASTDSNYAYQFNLPGTFNPCADFDLLKKAADAASSKGFRYHAGAVFSSDMFSDYNALGSKESWQGWSAMGCLAQDMETYALYCTAARLGKKALSILTHTDSCVTGKGLPKSKRMSTLEPMFETALACV